MIALPRSGRAVPALLLTLATTAARAQVCNGLEDCDNGVRCYVAYAYKWCGSPDVNVYNHTPYQGVWSIPGRPGTIHRTVPRAPSTWRRTA